MRRPLQSSLSILRVLTSNQLVQKNCSCCPQLLPAAPPAWRFVCAPRPCSGPSAPGSAGCTAGRELQIQRGCCLLSLGSGHRSTTLPCPRYPCTRPVLTKPVSPRHSRCNKNLGIWFNLPSSGCLPGALSSNASSSGRYVRMCTPTPRSHSKDLKEPVFRLGNPLFIQICNCESQKSLAGADGTWPCAAARPWLHSASLSLL